MAFDGITIANMVKEFQDTIVGERSTRSHSRRLTNC